MGYVAIGLAIISIVFAIFNYIASYADPSTIGQMTILKLETIIFILLGIFIVLLYFTYKSI